MDFKSVFLETLFISVVSLHAFLVAAFIGVSPILLTGFMIIWGALFSLARNALYMPMFFRCLCCWLSFWSFAIGSGVYTPFFGEVYIMPSNALNQLDKSLERVGFEVLVVFFLLAVFLPICTFVYDFVFCLLKHWVGGNASSLLKSIHAKGCVPSGLSERILRVARNESTTVSRYLIITIEALPPASKAKGAFTIYGGRPPLIKIKLMEEIESHSAYTLAHELGHLDHINSYPMRDGLSLPIISLGMLKFVPLQLFHAVIGISCFYFGLTAFYNFGQVLGRHGSLRWELACCMLLSMFIHSLSVRKLQMNESHADLFAELLLKKAGFSPVTKNNYPARGVYARFPACRCNACARRLSELPS